MSPGGPAKEPRKAEDRERLLGRSPRVLVIYSQDHPLYTDIVLKLCAFLQAKCGTEVLIDLLDSASVGMVGPLRWLELQLQKLQGPCDKILVLCSRGFQAKWRAICGQGRVTLRQDVLSPTPEMVTPFLNLLLPDMHQAGSLGKYVIAYFEEVTGEQDVLSLFGVSVKYKLMKHFEQLYFRLLDMEKYQPHQVNHIQGVGPDDYFRCASGAALRDAVRAFGAFQAEHPDWFQKECVHGEEDLLWEAGAPVCRPQAPGVQRRLALLRDGPPVYACQVEVQESAGKVYVCSPEPRPPSRRPAAVEQAPMLRAFPPHEVGLDGGPLGLLLPAEDEREWGPPLPGKRRPGVGSSSVEQGRDPGPWPAGAEGVQSSRSDPGYVSKLPSPPEPASGGGSLEALRKLQLQCLLSSLHRVDQGETSA